MAAAGKDALLIAAANAAWGELYLDAHDPGPAADHFRAALAADASWAPAHAGLASALARENPPAAAAAAARAVEIDPALTAAHVVLARAALDADRIDDARGHLARALSANPGSAEAHAYGAAIEYVAGRTAEYQAAAAKALAVNPAYGGLYRIVASQAASNYRYDEAVVLARKGRRPRARQPCRPRGSRPAPAARGR